MKSWTEGLGQSRGTRGYSSSSELARERHVLAWALSAAATAGDVWWSLADFVTRYYEIHGRTSRYHSVWIGDVAWKPPTLVGRGSAGNDRQEWERRNWFEHDALGL